MDMIPDYGTDLAAERVRANDTTPGIRRSKERLHGLPITYLTISDAADATQTKLAPGNYLTIEYPADFQGVIGSAGESVLPALLSDMIPAGQQGPLLVIGIGNSALLSDTVGARVIEGVYATAHQNKSGIIALLPGTEDVTGIPLVQHLSALTAAFAPRAVIAIDSLTTRSRKRLLSTIQLTDTGIVPGSGIRASRTRLDKTALGCPVIAIGIPTVISANAIAEELLDFLPQKQKASPEDVLYFSPCSAEIGIARGSALIASAINHLTNLF